MYTKNISDDVRQELIDLIIEELENGYDGYVCDLHNRVFNEDYFIIGTWAAEQWLIKNYGVFDAIGDIQEYEQDNFGEVNTDLSQPENVCNMLVYILGEEIMQDVKALQDSNSWNNLMDDETRNAILAELKNEELEPEAEESEE